MLAAMCRIGVKSVRRALGWCLGLSTASAAAILLPAIAAERAVAAGSGTNTRPNMTADGKIGLRLLYSGKPGSEREQEFVEFLSKYFREVRTGDWSRFDRTQGEDCDVVIVDYPGDGFKAPGCQLPRDYRHPVVTVGVAGGLLASRMGLKTGYT